MEESPLKNHYIFTPPPSSTEPTVPQWIPQRDVSVKRLEVGNTSGGALTFRLALMTVENGTPGDFERVPGLGHLGGPWGGVELEERGAAVGTVFLREGLGGGFDDLYWPSGGDSLGEG
jgi:hypothetical protein